ncbi:MAG: hypothetical protein H6Q74_3158 [Firmicutes bacterium]|nr:hypothetical protein [Bacillota bacterium]
MKKVLLAMLVIFVMSFAIPVGAQDIQSNMSAADRDIIISIPGPVPDEPPPPPEEPPHHHHHPKPVPPPPPPPDGGF